LPLLCPATNDHRLKDDGLHTVSGLDASADYPALRYPAKGDVGWVLPVVLRRGGRGLSRHGLDVIRFWALRIAGAVEVHSTPNGAELTWVWVHLPRRGSMQWSWS
jgi:hypothetical protein